MTTRSSRKLHLHVENSPALDEVFEASPRRVRAALARRPEVRARTRVTVGYGGDILERALRTADVLLCWDIDRSRLRERAPRLKWIHVHGAGVEHWMPLDWLPPDMVLTNSSGVHGRRAVEYGAAAVLMLNNRIPELATHQRARRWRQCFNSSLDGKTLLVVGVGAIGGGIARWAKSMDMEVLGVRRSARPHRHCDEMHAPAGLGRLMGRADFVLVSAPLTDDTLGLVGAREIARMRHGAGLVNFSRARVVDYEALRARLERGELSAVLDVFDPEPLPRSSPLWRTPNLIITPHCGSDDTESYTPRTLDLVVENIARHLAGKPLRNKVDRALRY